MYKPIRNEIFHVHTRRCKHAGEESDREYVNKAVTLGADRIVFTDHCPFPGDFFRNRMDMNQLEEYFKSLKDLRSEYENRIEILIGLEAEFLPGFKGYYEELKGNASLDILILGQHFYESPDGVWNYLEPDKSREFEGLFEAMVAGTETGLFDVIAHPDRAFRRCKAWNGELEHRSKTLVGAAEERGIYLEKNYSSMERKNQYWKPFWDMVPEELCLYGYDAHSLSELEERWRKRDESCL